MNAVTWFIQCLTITVPLLVAGLCLVIVLKRGLLKWLDLPLDANLRLRQRRILGNHKTLKGAVVLILFTIASTWALHSLQPYAPNVIHPIFAQPPLALGLVYAVGYILGELINSFIKRQLDIAPGDLHYTWRQLQRFFDLADGIALTTLLLGVLWPIYATQFFVAATIGIVFHYLIEILMQHLSLKPKLQTNPGN